MGYKLPVTLRESLRAPIGKLFTGNHSISTKNAIEYIERMNKGLSVAIGDVCTKNLLNQQFYPNIIVFDKKTQRTENISLELQTYLQREAYNPKEWILESAIQVIKNAIAFSTSNNCRIAVRIDGEEDLLIIPAIISLPLGSVVIYGQPPITTEEGLVVALITSSLKNKVQDILNKFEFYEVYINGNHHY